MLALRLASDSLGGSPSRQAERDTPRLVEFLEDALSGVSFKSQAQPITGHGPPIAAR